jgi:hypothetical protein
MIRSTDRLEIIDYDADILAEVAFGIGEIPFHMFGRYGDSGPDKFDMVIAGQSIFHPPIIAFGRPDGQIDFSFFKNIDPEIVDLGSVLSYNDGLVARDAELHVTVFIAFGDFEAPDNGSDGQIALSRQVGREKGDGQAGEDAGFPTGKRGSPGRIKKWLRHR